MFELDDVDASKIVRKNRSTNLRYIAFYPIFFYFSRCTWKCSLAGFMANFVLSGTTTSYNASSDLAAAGRGSSIPKVNVFEFTKAKHLRCCSGTVSQVGHHDPKVLTLFLRGRSCLGSGTVHTIAGLEPIDD